MNYPNKIFDGLTHPNFSDKHELYNEVNNLSKNYSEKFYEKYSRKYQVLYDDREVRAGEKFNDMDLIGIPLQLIIGEKNLSNSNIEVKQRNTGKLELINIDNIENYLEKKCEF